MKWIRGKVAEVLAKNGLDDVSPEIRKKVLSACNDVLKWKDEQVQGFLFAETIYTAPQGMLEGLTVLNDDISMRWLNYQIGVIKKYDDCSERIKAVRRANAIMD